MSKVVYSKKGGLTPKEKKLVKGIENYLSTNSEAESSFETIDNFSELEKYYNEKIVSDVHFEEVPDKGASNAAENSTATGDFVIDYEKEHRDVLNADEPIIRDYVKEDVFSQDGQQPTQTQMSFGEPISFGESFEIPESLDGKGNNNGGQSSGQQSGFGNGKKTQKTQEPLNPEFDSMKQSSKNKSTKRFAKYIVEVTCMLMEKGFVWYATKDITEASLLEKELSGEITLNILLSMEGGQEITVRDFFAKQCLTAEKMSKIDAEEKQDLADALYLVLMEKGVAPSPTQELMLVALSIVGKQAVNLLAFKAQNISVLIQLQALRQQGAPTSTHYAPPPPPPNQQQEENQNNTPEQNQTKQTGAEANFEILDEKQPANVTAE